MSRIAKGRGVVPWYESTIPLRSALKALAFAFAAYIIVCGGLTWLAGVVL